MRRWCWSELINSRTSGTYAKTKAPGSPIRETKRVPSTRILGWVSPLRTSFRVRLTRGLFQKKDSKHSERKDEAGLPNVCTSHDQKRVKNQQKEKSPNSFRTFAKSHRVDESVSLRVFTFLQLWYISSYTDYTKKGEKTSSLLSSISLVISLSRNCLNKDETLELSPVNQSLLEWSQNHRKTHPCWDIKAVSTIT